MGINSLEFVTLNGGAAENPHGFRAELSGTAVVPEPSTLALALVGLLGLAMFGRRRRAA